MIDNWKFRCRHPPLPQPIPFVHFHEILYFLKRIWVNSSLAWQTDTWFPETLPGNNVSVLFWKFPGEAYPHSPPTPPRALSAQKVPKICHVRCFQEHVRYFTKLLKSLVGQFALWWWCCASFRRQRTLVTCFWTQNFNWIGHKNFYSLLCFWHESNAPPRKRQKRQIHRLARTTREKLTITMLYVMVLFSCISKGGIELEFICLVI